MEQRFTDSTDQPDENCHCEKGDSSRRARKQDLGRAASGGLLEIAETIGPELDQGRKPLPAGYIPSPHRPEDYIGLPNSRTIVGVSELSYYPLSHKCKMALRRHLPLVRAANKLGREGLGLLPPRNREA